MQPPPVITLPKGLFFQLALHAFMKTAYIDSKTALIVFPGLYGGNQKQWNMIRPLLFAGFFANAFFFRKVRGLRSAMNRNFDSQETTNMQWPE